MKAISKEDHLRAYYRALFQAWGRQHWWPARTRFEVIVAAYLTQNTAWTNVERALRSLRASGLVTIDGIRRVPLPQWEALYSLRRLLSPEGEKAEDICKLPRPAVRRIIKSGCSLSPR